MATVVVARTLSINEVGSQTFAAGLTLVAGDVVYLIMTSGRVPPRSVQTLTGLGGTWQRIARAPNGGMDVWVTLDPTATGNIVMTPDGSDAAAGNQCQLFQVRGITDPLTAYVVEQASTTNQSTSVGPAVNVVNGQLVVTVQHINANAAVTAFPSVELPAAWAYNTQSTPTNRRTLRADVVSTSSPTPPVVHRVDGNLGAARTVQSATVVIGKGHTPYQDAVLASSPTAYWPMDDQALAVLREVTAARDGAYVGTPALRAAGLTVEVPDYSVDFSASSQRGQVTTPAVGGHWSERGASFTASCWIRPDAPTGSNQDFYAHDDSGTNLQWRMFLGTTGKLTAYHTFVSSGIVAVSGATTLVAGTAYHVALRKTAGSGIHLILNGVEDGFTANANNPSIVYTVPIVMGALANASEPFDGKISKAAFWNSTAVPTATLLAHYRAGAGIVTTVPSYGWGTQLV